MWQSPTPSTTGPFGSRSNVEREHRFKIVDRKMAPSLGILGCQNGQECIPRLDPLARAPLVQRVTVFQVPTLRSENCPPRLGDDLRTHTARQPKR